MDTDILIVGAGPTGLMLANQLARRGVQAMIIDRNSGPAQQTRAMAVQARTLEIYSKMGIADTALALGARGNGANLWANGRWTARVPVADIGKGISPFPFVLMLGQDDNEQIMGAKLRALGVAVQWSTELVALEQQADHVRVVLRQPDGTTRELTAGWVAGCDGSRSRVRELNGIAFQGAAYEHTFFVADTEATGPMKPQEVNAYLWKGGFHLFFPMRGKDRWRVIGILPKTLRQRDDLEFEDIVPAIREEAGAALDFTRCHWFSTYRIYHRAAQRFQDRRCFILGDAAHVHSPMGGQGMNTGLQDAYNLAWKLALVVKGRADPTLLESYEQERMPVARRLLETTDRAFQLAISDGWLAGLLRTRIIAQVAAWAMSFERVRILAFRTLSQTGIAYSDSTLSRSADAMPPGAPAAGDRFPWMHLRLQAGGPIEDLYRQLDDLRLNLIVFGQPGPSGEWSGLDGLLSTCVVPADAANEKELARVKIPQTSFYLLRPDGHIGMCGTRFDAGSLKSYLADRLRLHVGGEQSIVSVPFSRCA